MYEIAVKYQISFNYFKQGSTGHLDQEKNNKKLT